MTLRILGRKTSINVRKVLWLAAEAGLDAELEEWGKPLRDPQVPEFLALNPNGQVPVLIDGAFVLWESHAILRYLADRAGHESWPEDRRERALVDQWLSWQSTELNPAWSYAVRALLRGDPPVPDAARLADSVATWNRCMGILDRQLQRGSGFVANDRFSLADIVMALSTHRWLSVPIARPDLKAVVAHLERMRARPAGFPWLGAHTP